MIDIGMFAALGFLVASLLALLIAPAFWNRAVRLTTRRLEATMPMSLADIQADKDQLRAEFAIELRRIEFALEKAKDKAARELMEANKRRVKIAELGGELEGVKSALEESHNANRVLEQTIKRRLPDMEARLKTAKHLMAELEQANAEFRHTIATQSEALKSARATVQSQKAELDRLRATLEGGALRGLGKSDARLEKEVQRVSAELSRTREELERNKITREQHDLLRQELAKLANQILAVAKGQGPSVPLSMASTPFREVRDIAQAVAAYARPAPPEISPVVIPAPPALDGANGASHEAPSAEAAEATDTTDGNAPSATPSEDIPPPALVSPTNGDARHAGEAQAERGEAQPNSRVTNGHANHGEDELRDGEEDAEPEKAPAEANGNGVEATNGDVVHADGEPEPLPAEKPNEAPRRESLVRRLTARRGRRHGPKGRNKSLSERLQSMPAEISER